jgi:thiamine biosynthesis lipoprotein
MPAGAADEAGQDRWRVAIPCALSPAALVRPGGELQTLAGAAMGTSWRVTFVGSPTTRPAAQSAVERILDRVVGRFSPWEPGSELNRFNATRPGTWHDPSADFAKVTRCALLIAEETGGACDPALGALVDLWGFGATPRRRRVPSRREIEQALQNSGWRHITQAQISGRLSRKTPVRLDFCGIAKGYAVDLLAQSFRDSGIAAALVEIGGELSGYGVKPDGTPWWVAVDGDSGGKAPILVALHGLAIATSGCERGFIHAGKHYSHTIDPATGWPIDNGMLSATVLHDSCMQADAYATALMAMGPDAAIAFADAHALAAAIRYRGCADKVTERVSAQLQSMLDG